MQMFRSSAICTAFICSVWAAPTYFNATDARVVYSGSRFLTTAESVSFVWSGATISTTFTGTSIGVIMQDAHGQYDVIIDGQKSFQPFSPQANSSRAIPIASQLADESHTFVLRKRTEGYSNVYGDGTASIFGFFVDQDRGLLKTNAPFSSTPFSSTVRKIEVIGDSITCGSGILGENSSCNFSFDTQDYFSSYSYLVASKFRAQINAVCWSGKGLVRNYNVSCEICNDSMLSYYPYTLADEDALWNFSSFVPNAVIINLGTNDFDTQNPPPALPNDTFVGTYVQFVRDLRTNHYRNMDVHIFLVCRYGNTLPGPCALVQQVFAKLKDDHVHYVDITPSSEPNSTLGCGGHPGLSGHRQMADKIIASMGPIVGWSIEIPPSHLEASSAVLLGAFFLIGLGGHIWGCVVRKPKAKSNLLLEQKQDR